MAEKDIGFIQRANVKIVSDGTHQGTDFIFVDPETGEQRIFPVMTAEWSLSMLGDAIPKLTVRMMMTPVEIEIASKDVTIIPMLTDYPKCSDRIGGSKGLQCELPTDHEGNHKAYQTSWTNSGKLVPHEKLCWAGPTFSHPAHLWDDHRPGGKTYRCPGASTDRT